MTLRDEILEQPESVARLIDRGRRPIEAIAAAVHAADPAFLVIAARGSSDHAAIYAQYVFGIRHRLAVALAAPSIVSLYGVRPAVERALVLGISQSGASPDVVGVVEAAREAGGPTIALTNEPGSALAAAAAHVIDLMAGPERAVAATKTYTAELTAMAMLSAALRGSEADWAEIAAVPGQLAAVLETEDAARRLAADRASIERGVVLGRGFEYATARELALKLKELARVLADPYSAADFEHGPVALVRSGFPILAVVGSGPTLEPTLAQLARLRSAFSADVIVISDSPEAERVGARIAVPAGVPEWLRPIVSIVAGQLFALHLTIARGIDPDNPVNIHKVTLTR